MEKIDKLTIRELKKGSHQAFQQIFICYFRNVKCFIKSFLKSEEEAEELAQDVFMKIWENHPFINLDKSFDSYLFTITRNLIFNFLKHKLVEKNYQEYVYFSKSEFAHDPEKVLYAKEIELIIEMTISKMPDRRREIYHLSRHKGLGNDEIANMLSISKKTVENQLSIALNELKKIVYLIHFLLLLH